MIGLTQALSLWFFARNAYLPGIRESAKLTVLQAEMVSDVGSRDFEVATRIARATGIEYDRRDVPDRQHLPLFARPVVDRFHEEVQKQLGETVDIRYEEGRTPVLWVSAPSLGDGWLRVPMGFFRHYDRYLLVGWGVTIPLFSVLGGLLIARGLSRPLRRLEQLVVSLGRNDSGPKSTRISGPEEVVAVHRALIRMARELEQAQRDRALLLAGVSHDLRTPLTRLRLSAEFLDDKELSAGIVSDVEDMDAILEQFISFIRDGSDEEAVSENINDLIVDVCDRFEQLDIQLRLQTVPRLLLKRLSFKRLLTNLLANIVKYGEPPVEIRTRMDFGEIVLVVRDHGKGVVDRDMQQLLQPFTRGDEARTLTGSGLGLAIVKRIVDMHHGRLNLSNHPGGGLQVEIRLPASGQFIQPESLSTRVR